MKGHNRTASIAPFLVVHLVVSVLLHVVKEQKSEIKTVFGGH